jgi:hypothetical protein
MRAVQQKKRKMGNVFGGGGGGGVERRREREEEPEKEEEDYYPYGQKRAKSTLELLAQDYVPLSAGGNACVLKSKDGASILRIANGATDRALDQQKLHKKLPWFVPEVTIHHEYRNYDDFIANGGKVFVDMMAPIINCGTNFVRFYEQNTPIRITKMQFIQGTDLTHFHAMFPDPLATKRLFFRLLAGLYVLQKEFGFEHGDLTGHNLMIAVPGQLGDFMPVLIDYDFAKFFPQVRADRKFGNYFLWPIEFSGNTSTPADRMVRGAADLWAVGINLFGISLTGNPSALAASSQLRNALNIQDLSFSLPETVVMQVLQHFVICAAHAVLMGDDIRLYPMHINFNNIDIDSLWGLQSRLTARGAIYQYIANMYVPTIRKFDVTLKEILKQLLHLNPKERTYNGEVPAYFVMNYFFQVQDARFFIAKYVRPYISNLNPQALLPAIGSNMMDQIRNIYALGIMAKCVDCSADASHYDTHRERLICAACANQ